MHFPGGIPGYNAGGLIMARTESREPLLGFLQELVERKRRWIRLAAIGFALLAFASAIWGPQPGRAPRYAVIRAVAARRSLLPGEVLHRADLTTTLQPAATEPSVLTRTEDAEGRVITRAVRPGEPIRRKEAIPALQYYGVALRVPPGMRAVNLAVPASSTFGGELVPGLRIDLLGAFEAGQERAAVTLLTSGIVLRVDDRSHEHPLAAPPLPLRPGGEGLATSFLEVIVAVPSTRVREVTLAQAFGRIFFVAHPLASSDADSSTTGTLTLRRYLNLPLGQASPPRAPFSGSGWVLAPPFRAEGRVPHMSDAAPGGARAGGVSPRRRPAPGLRTDTWSVEVIEGDAKSVQRVPR
jgi:Flp pilus assembly protein CpaB